MNKSRRKRLEDVVDLLSRANEILTEVRDEEYDAYDNLPEGLQESEKGETLYENYETLDSQADAIDEAIDEINNIIG